MDSKEQRSVEQVKRLFAALGWFATRIEPIAQEGRSRPDVFVEIDGRKISIEATDYHGDEKEMGGSPLRRQEEEDAAAGQIRTYGVPTDPMPGLLKRVKEKVAKSYDLSDADELWLVIFAGVPQWGTVAPTFLPTIFFNLDELTKQTSHHLESSQFSRCYLFCEVAVKRPTLYSWTKGDRWQEVRISTGQTDPTQTLSFWDIQRLLKGSKK